MTIPEAAKAYVDSGLHILVEWALGALFAWIGFQLRKLVKAIGNVQKVPTIERRVNAHASIIDAHTDALESAGWVKRGDLKRVTEQRRSEDFA